MPQPESDGDYAELMREISALEAEFATSEVRNRLADVGRRIETLYESLRENRLLLETVLENSAASIYAKRKDGRYIYINREMEILCNVTRERGLGRTDFELFPTDIAQQWRSNDVKAMLTGTLSQSEETVQGARGERTVLAKSVPLISRNGDIEGICGISTDITDLRRTELALREAVAKLERERDSKLLNIEAITASIAHEVRQPLTAIATYANAAQQFLGRTPLDVDELRTIVDQIGNDCRRTNEIFDGIRSLFRRADQPRVPIEINQTALDVLQSLAGELRDHRIATHTVLAAGLPPVYGHQGQLRQVITNLVHNAIEAMETTTDRGRELRLTTNPQGGNAIVVAVEDSGPGIDPAQLGSIFEAFVTTKAKGMGLGLAICRMIVHRHGGQLSASSDGKSGARFQLVLPVE
ncbi:MAG TPA: ATP-binding protein [Stellaceae bacterium]|jgi:PAS domain S-box-containing protein|nr:ATP-binding protein [Stellaceae bacterium]